MARALTQTQVRELASRLPIDRPYTAAEATKLGVNNAHRRMLVRLDLIRRPVMGVFHAAGLRDDLALRIAVLKLIVPPDCVVTDRTAAWLWGATMALAPGDHRQVPLVSVFAPPGRRLRNGVSISGERMLARRDVMEVSGLLVTSPLRTTCDLLRLLHRDHALAAADALAKVGGFGPPEIGEELERFKGYRGVVQARALAFLVDPDSDSAMESITRLRWHDAGLPWPTCQVMEPRPDGSWFAIDIGLPEERFGVEYFGEEFHGPEQEADDLSRLDWLRDERDWYLLVARKDNVIGRQQDLVPTLQLAWAAHRKLVRR